MKRKDLLTIVLLLVLVVSVASLTGYLINAVNSQSTVETMRELYQQPTDTPIPTMRAQAEATEETNPPTAAPTEIPQQTEALRQAETPQETETRSDQLPKVTYGPEAYSRHVTAFAKLIQLNEDIVAWLEVPDLVEQAVVLRDNSYYLTRDYTGAKNVNGALFLDECISFSGNARPYTYIVYGHNMKTGAMFGRLSKYEDISWYRTHAFVTFNTVYESGEFVIFAVEKRNVTGGETSLYQLYSSSVEVRQATIRSIRQGSAIDVPLDVQADDQLLLLVTCTGDDDERLVISARKLREDETEERLQSDVIAYCGSK